LEEEKQKTGEEGSVLLEEEVGEGVGVGGFALVG